MTHLLNLTFIILFVTVSTATYELSFDKNRIQWEEYKSQYSLKFDIKEDEYRFQVYRDNIKYIEEINSQNLGFECGMNNFGHLTNDEFKKFVNPMIREGKIRSKPEKNGLKQIYPDMDWRTKGIITSVKDQLYCGSCYAFASIAVLESQYANLTGKLVDLSEQQIVDCSFDYGNNGCDGGWMDNSFQYVADKGIYSEKSYPYKGKEQSCKITIDKPILNVDRSFELKPNDEDELQKTVSEIGPVAVGIHGTLRSFQFYKRGVYNPKDCLPEELDHTVIVVGLGSKDSTSYIIKNSWSRYWGERGYARIARNGKNTCGIATAPTYALIKFP